MRKVLTIVSCISVGITMSLINFLNPGMPNKNYCIIAVAVLITTCLNYTDGYLRGGRG